MLSRTCGGRREGNEDEVQLPIEIKQTTTGGRQ
jgi:hypothetical protein